VYYDSEWQVRAARTGWTSYNDFFIYGMEPVSYASASEEAAPQFIDGILGNSPH